MDPSKSSSILEYQERIESFLPLLREIFPDLEIRTAGEEIAFSIYIRGSWTEGVVGFFREGQAWTPDGRISQSSSVIGGLVKMRKFSRELQDILDAVQMALNNLPEIRIPNDS